MRFLYILYILIFFLSCPTHTSAKTIADIQHKAGWQPPLQSQRKSTYRKPITPAKLVVFIERYKHKTIKIQALFGYITIRGLNKWITSDSNHNIWRSKKYAAFTIRDPNHQADKTIFSLFLDKQNPDIEKLLKLKSKDKITITGFVRIVTSYHIYINVDKIEQGWQK